MINIKLQFVLKFLNNISVFFYKWRLYFNIFLVRSNFIGIVADSKLDIGLYQTIISEVQNQNTKIIVFGYNDVLDDFSLQTLLHKYPNRVFFFNLNKLFHRVLYYYIDCVDSHGSFRNRKYFPFQKKTSIWHGEPAKTIISNSDSRIYTDRLLIPNFGYFNKLKHIFSPKSIIISNNHPRFIFLRDLNKIRRTQRLIVLAPTYLNSKGSLNPNSYKSESNLYENFVHYLCMANCDFLNEFNRLLTSYNLECHMYFHPYDKFDVPDSLENIKTYSEISLVTKYEILSNAKFLITDSSSIAFDAIELKVPIINIHHKFKESDREKIYVESRFNVDVDQFLNSIKDILIENDNI